MRTIVISDIHGYPELVTNALEHAGFRKGEDRFVFAGDMLDGGPDAGRAFALIDDLADVVLVGNHEVASMLGQEIEPQGEDAFDYADRFLERFVDSEGRFGGRWKLAHEVDGILVCHSCVSDAFEPEFEAAGRDVAAFAERLSDEFRALFADAGSGGAGPGAHPDEWSPAARRFLGATGPLWYRPLLWGRAAPLPGIVQVVGHTAPELYRPKGLAIIESLGIHLVAPAVNAVDEHWLAHAYRYGVIEDGQVRVESWQG